MTSFAVSHLLKSYVIDDVVELSIFSFAEKREEKTNKQTRWRRNARRPKRC